MERELDQDEDLKELFGVIARLRSVEECARFFRDLCTLTELKAMSERWKVAQMVFDEMPYRRISRETGASTATITRIAHWLHHGEGGYRMVLEKFKEKEGR